MPKLRTEVENTFGPLLSDYLSRAPLPNAQPLEGSEESHSTGLLNIVEKVYDISSGTVSHPILGQLLKIASKSIETTIPFGAGAYAAVKEAVKRDAAFGQDVLVAFLENRIENSAHYGREDNPGYRWGFHPWGGFYHY